MTDQVVEKNVGGRPSTLTREIGQAIADQVRETLSINFAAEGLSVPRSTVQSWISQGNKDIADNIDSDYAWFSHTIKIARSYYVQNSIKILREMPKNWQAQAWILERCCAEEFGKDSELYKQLLDDYKMLMQSLIDNQKNK